MVGLEQILDDGAAGRNLCIGASEFDPRVSGSDVGLSVIRADRVGLTIPGLHIEPCRFLVLVIVGEGSSRRRDRSA